MPAAFHSSQLGEVRAATVAARHEGRFCLDESSGAPHRILAAGHLRRIRLRPDQDEVVVHHLVAAHAVALGDELLLERPRVHEHHVGVAAPAHVERLAGAERHHAHLDAGLLLEDGQQVLEQAGLLGRGGRGDGDVALLCPATGAGHAARAAAAKLGSNPWQFSFDECRRLRAWRVARRISRPTRAPPRAPGAGRSPRRPGAAPGRGCAWPSRSWCPAPSKARITASISRVAVGSRLAVGSSRNSTSGCSAQARASARRCCSPPERMRAGRCATRREAHLGECLRSPARSASATRRRSSAYSTLSSAERRSITGRWNTMACLPAALVP